MAYEVLACCMCHATEEQVLLACDRGGRGVDEVLARCWRGVAVTPLSTGVKETKERRGEIKERRGETKESRGSQVKQPIPTPACQHQSQSYLAQLDL